MPTITVENYIKCIYAEQTQHPGELVAMGQLATAMGVTPGTATAMVKTLAEAQLLEYERRGGVKLTEKGSRLALQILRRHRLVESFLVETLKLDWSEVHEEAEELEHAVSEKVLDRIDELLGHPDADPHGDPIPPADGSAMQRAHQPNLVECQPGQTRRIARVRDQSPKFLQFLDRHRLMPGQQVTIVDRDAAAEVMTVQADGVEAVTLAAGAAAKILVEGNR